MIYCPRVDVSIATQFSNTYDIVVLQIIECTE